MARPKIAFVITRSDAIGGAQIHVCDLAAALQDTGHDVRVWVGGDGPFVDLLGARGVSVRSLEHLVAPISPRTDMRAALELRRALAAYQPDLVTLHSSKAGVVGRLATRGLGVPVIFTAHGWAFVEGVPRRQAMVYRRAERLLAPLADRIITVSQFDKQLAANARVGRPDQVVCVPNGVRDVRPELRADPGAGPPRLTVVARLDVPKDPFTLLKALHALRDRAFSLEWIGDGPRRLPAQRLAASLGLEDRVQFVGSRDDVPARLARSSMLLLPTDREGLPLCILEGMRAGLPVVASAVGGIPEAVADGQTGRLVLPRDVSSLSHAIGALLDNPAARTKMGAAGRQRYEARFSFARQYMGTVGVYRSLVSSIARTRPTFDHDHANP
ncbi:MAG: glycosyltransferase family 4 protein [Deltaproteobacteria bacterium]|nr:glycosyltransferase family 4 protein [Deltaproteobacteria bacterium]